MSGPFLFWFALLSSSTFAVVAIGTVHSEHETWSQQCDSSEPLLLSPLIAAGRLEEARQMSRADIPELNGTGPTGYSGFLTVNESDGGNLFFWYFEHEDFATMPLIVWLQGGPGDSSLFGLLVENGPYKIGANALIQLRGENNWSNLANIVYIDNPVMTGFSFTNSSEGYARDEVQIGWSLYRFLLQFYQLFPYLRSNDLILSGESYAGKFLPALAHRIDSENQHTEIALPLVAIIMGGAISDPVNMYTAYGPMLYEMGLLDRNELSEVNKMSTAAVKLIKNGKRAEAVVKRNEIFDYYKNVTGLNDVLNVRNVDNPWSAMDRRKELFQRCDIRRAMHVGQSEYHDGSDVMLSMAEDHADSVAEWMPNLFERYRWLLYSGQWDMIVGAALTNQMLERMQWRSKQAFERAVRRPWKVDEADAEVAGFVQQAGCDFAQVIVRDAGHLVQLDQPRRAFHIMRNFIGNISL